MRKRLKRIWENVSKHAVWSTVIGGGILGVLSFGADHARMVIWGALNDETPKEALKPATSLPTLVPDPKTPALPLPTRGDVKEHLIDDNVNRQTGLRDGAFPSEKRFEAFAASAQPRAVTPATLPNYINRGAFNSAFPAVLIWDPGSNKRAEVTDQIADRLKGTSGLFTDEFVSSGRFDRATRGDKSAMIDAGLTEDAASAILVGSRLIEVTPQEVPGEKIFKAVVTASIRIYTPGAGFASEPFVVGGEATAFTAREAERYADQKLAEQVVRRLSGAK